LISNYITYFYVKDARSYDYLLVKNDPIPVLTIIAAYLAFIFFGKKFMENRLPFNIPNIILIGYNFYLVGLSAYMAKEVVINLLNIIQITVYINDL
jgi:hypothetical protein